KLTLSIRGSTRSRPEHFVAPKTNRSTSLLDIPKRHADVTQRRQLHSRSDALRRRAPSPASRPYGSCDTHPQHQTRGRRLGIYAAWGAARAPHIRSSCRHEASRTLDPRAPHHFLSITPTTVFNALIWHAS